MPTKKNILSQRYLAALRRRLTGKRRGLSPANGLGKSAIALGLETLDLARMHEWALLTLLPNPCSVDLLDKIREQSGIFFMEAVAPIQAGNGELKKEIVQRKAAEAALKDSERHHLNLLQQSRFMEQRLRRLSHRLISAQEEERKKISHELHDHIAQMLAGINVHLATLRGAAAHNRHGLNRKVRETQRLVEKSVNVVHSFARELRPPVLDDLGLIPALQSFLKSFTERTGILVRLTVVSGVEELRTDKRTVIYRVAQAALTNVGLHADADRVVLSILKVSNAIEMTVVDNGRGFDVASVLHSGKNRRLGLIGMGERAEMVGGSFRVTSTSGVGTTIWLRIPSGRSRRAP